MGAMTRPTDTIADAQAAALFLRNLVEEGVPLPAAVQLTASYVTALVIHRHMIEPPREPWEDDT